MATSPKAAKHKARKAHVHARQADARYRVAKTHAKRSRAAKKRDNRRTAQRRAQSPAARVGRSRTLGVVGYVLIGIFPYAASALILPPGAALVLMALWAFGLAWTVRIGRTAPAWTPVGPLVAIVAWVVLAQLGDAAFNWFS